MKPSNKLALYSMLQNGFAIKQENRRREQGLTQELIGEEATVDA